MGTWRNRNVVYFYSSFLFSVFIETEKLNPKEVITSVITLFFIILVVSWKANTLS
jgi:hypothetical protein